jgi:hypothetical protein
VDSADEIRRLPAAVFDNRRDYTSFLREDPGDWPEQEIAGIHKQLQDALGRLAGAPR